MERWKYYDITHRNHIVCNPTSQAKYDQLLGLLHLSEASQVLEIATGKGELMTQLIERFGVSGVAVDLSPYHSRDARATFAARVPAANLTFLEMDGAAYQPEKPDSFDLTACLGASWIYDGHQGTLQALMGWTKPGGYVLVGEPYWIQEPPAKFIEKADYDRDTFGTHLENCKTGRDLGLMLRYTLVSNYDEWDMYVGLGWDAAYQYAQENPDDPDIPELLRWLENSQRDYLRWQRDCLGWAIYLFQKPLA